MDSYINPVAVLLAGAAALALKYLWYSSLLFKEQHEKLSKNHHSAKNDKRKNTILNASLELLLYSTTAFVIYHLINISGSFYYEFSPVTVGINTAFWVWIGFVLPIQINDMAERHRSWRLLIINAGFRYFSLIVMALIIARFSFN